MDFDRSEEERLIQETAREFAESVLRSAAVELDHEERFPEEHWRRLADLGFLSFLIPEEHGGTGLGPQALVIVLEELSRACAATGFQVAIQNLLVAGPIARFGSAAQKSRHLPPLARGEVGGASLLLEASATGEAGGVEAEERGAGFVLRGRGRLVGRENGAGLVLVLAGMGPPGANRSSTAFILDGGLAGLSVSRRGQTMGLRAAAPAALLLEEVKAPREAVLGEIGRGAEVAEDAADAGRLGLAAVGAGLIAAALDDSVKYAHEREQFGRPIASFQPIQRMIADMAADLEVARLLVAKAAWLRGAGRPHRAEAAQASLFAAEAANRAASQAVQVHGGAGYLKDFAVERYFRDAKTAEALGGADGALRHVLAARSLGE